MNSDIQSGGIELIDQIEPVWEELNRLHLQKSAFFSDDFKNFKFLKRKLDLECKAKSGNVRISLFKDEKRTVLGFIIASVTNGIGEIDSICVKSTARKNGIGSMLMSNTMQWFKQVNISKIMVTVVYGNEDAFSFYEKFGLYPRATTLTTPNWHTN